MTQVMPFGADPLDRVANERHNAVWVAARLQDPAARFLPMSRLQAPITEGEGTHLFWSGPEVLSRLGADVSPVLLGLLDGVPHFAIDISGVEDPLTIGENVTFVDPRPLGSRLPATDLGILAHARSLLDWHSRHGFCPACGARTEPQEGGSFRKCAGCGASHFPRTDPVVIMVVWRDDRCLLGKRAGAAGNRYSCISGYMDQGETVEAAVRREVREEVGVDVDDVRYITSQPWPFPSSLMLGFFAHATSDDFQVDEDEIAEARWFSREEIGKVIDGPSPEVGFAIPDRIAIAHHLIRTWHEKGPQGEI